MLFYIGVIIFLILKGIVSKYKGNKNKKYIIGKVFVQVTSYKRFIDRHSSELF